jgi:phage terminase large subunit
MRLCFPNLTIAYNKTDYYVTFANGSEIWFAGLDESRVEKILGMEFSTLYFNEASEIAYSPMELVLSRLAEKNDLVKRAYYDFNPPQKSHWAYDLFIKKLHPADAIPLENGNEYGWILMNPCDNLENIDESYIKILESMSEENKARFLRGEFTDNTDGQVYYEFKRDLHVRPVAKQPGTLFIGMDFNVNPFTGAIFQHLNNSFYIIDELYLENADTYKACFDLKQRGYIGQIIPDSTGHNRKTSGKSDFDILKENGFTLMTTFNPIVIDRVNNMNRLLHAGKIIIDPKCKKLINDLEKVTWKDGKLNQKSDSMLTHISDSLGYGTWRLDPISGIVQRIYSSQR